MDIPPKIYVRDLAANGGRPHAPDGFYDDSGSEVDSDEYYINDVHTEPIANLPTPPKKLTATDISEEERRRFARDTSMNGGNAGYPPDESLYKTPNDQQNDTILKNMNSFHSGDPVSLARLVRHLHNRVKLLEEDKEDTNRRIETLYRALFGLGTVYMLFQGFKWMFH